MYQSDLAGGPDVNNDVGGPASSEEAATRCTKVIWPVGPTLKRGHS